MFRARVAFPAFVVVATLGLTSVTIAVASGGPTAAARPRSQAITPGTDGAASKWAARPTVTLQLRPHGPRAESQIAAMTASPARSADTASARQVALARLTPTVATRSSIEQFLTARGLHIVAASNWTIEVGGPTARLASVFATSIHRVSSPLSPHAGRAFIAPTRRLRVPQSLRAEVSRAVGLDTRPVFRHASIPVGAYTGADIRSAYNATSSGTGSGLTLATIQFAPVNLGDVRTYANAAGITLGSGQISPISVGGAPSIGDDGNGTPEAVLDTETLLAVAPAAKQRIYVAGNDGSDTLQQEGEIVSDAQNNLVQAVSTSWGNCEPLVGRSNEKAEDAEFQLMVAAGATVFDASGDAGAYDCSAPGSPDATISVDYPGASPYVLAVGGTNLTKSGSSWTEKSWEDPQAGGNPAEIYQGYASGGGTSIYEARPSWQSTLIISGTHRLAPDIAADADPNTGMELYVSDDGGWSYEGGTSMAAPIETALYADALSQAGRTTGLGDIHAALYAAPASDFRDITVGGNYGYDAGPGYDEVTGLGAPLWNLFGPYLIASSGGPTPTPTPTTPTPTPSSPPPVGDFSVSAPAAANRLAVPITVSVTQGSFGQWAAGVGLSCASPGSDLTGAPPTQVTLPPTESDGTATFAVVGEVEGGGCVEHDAHVTLDRVKPVAAINWHYARGKLWLAWGSSDSAPSSGVKAALVIATHNGQKIFRAHNAHGATTKFRPQRGKYVAKIAVEDNAGNIGQKKATIRFS